MKITTMWVTTIMISLILMTAIQMTKKKEQQSKEKWTQIECGFNIMNPTHIPFSFQFFLIALLFLIFDVEISLVLSYPMEFTTTKNTTMISAFLLILTIGLIYEWQKGKINWSKWMGQYSLQE